MYLFFTNFSYLTYGYFLNTHSQIWIVKNFVSQF